ncbi:nuclear transport factor 2 family protein [Nonomuraea sp. bgisy101]|uniref:nuclear transport factor 2 family protein n=1 Tax=Nonomuraea sp. bgisy101 TaxID=3413784 RepID=UPI003D72CAF7
MNDNHNDAAVTAVADAYFGAWQANQPARLADVLADDVRVNGPLGQIDGAAQYQASLARIFSITGHLVFHKRWVDGTFVLTADLAAYLAAAVDADVAPGERVDIGWDRHVSIGEAAGLMSKHAAKTIKVRAVPSALTRAAGALMGPFMPMVKDMAAMFGWFDSGRSVADTRRQAQLFGPAPTVDDAIARLVTDLNHARRR